MKTAVTVLIYVAVFILKWMLKSAAHEEKHG